jgi:hypothetical protein
VTHGASILDADGEAHLMSHMDKCAQIQLKEPQTLEEAVRFGLSKSTDGDLDCGCEVCKKIAAGVTESIRDFLKQQQHIQAERIALLALPVQASAGLH